MTVNDLLGELGVDDDVEVDNAEAELVIQLADGTQVPVTGAEFDTATEKMVLKA